MEEVVTVEGSYCGRGVTVSRFAKLRELEQVTKSRNTDITGQPHPSFRSFR